MPIKYKREVAPPPETSLFDKAFEPLIDTHRTDEMANSITEPKLDDTENSAYWKGMLGGAVQGVGNVVSSFSSPAALASMLSGLGPLQKAASGIRGAATALRGIETGANAAFAAHGAKTIADARTTIPQKLAGGLEALAGGYGTVSGLHGLLGGASKVSPIKTFDQLHPKPVAEPPLEISTDHGQRTWTSPVKQKNQPRHAKPSPEETFNFQQDVTGGIDKGLKGTLTGDELITDLDRGISDATKQGTTARKMNERNFTSGSKAEQVADAQWYKSQQQADNELAALNEIERIKAEGGLEQQSPTVKKTTTAPSGLGKETATQTWKVPSEDEEGIEELADVLTPSRPKPGVVTRTRPVLDVNAPPTSGPAKDVYDAWLANGASQEDALTRAAGGVRHPSQATTVSIEPPLAASEPVQQAPTTLEDLLAPPAPIEPPIVEGAEPFSSNSSNAFTRSQQEQSYKELLAKLAGENVPIPEAVPSTRPQASPLQQQIAEQSVNDSAALRGTPADTAHSPLAQQVEAARTGKPPAPRYEGHPEVEDMFNQLGEAYRGGDKSKGRELAELRDFMQGGKMRESWKGAPKPPEAAAIDQQVAALPQAEPPSTQIEPPTPAEYNTSGDWVKDELSRIENPQSFLDKLKGQKGEIDPMMLTRLGLGGAGAVYGATQGDNFDERAAKALLYGGAGFFAPSAPGIISKIAKAPNVPEAIGEAVTKGAKIAPNVQRANYLADPMGIAANAIAGPYGSAVLGALKHTIASPWTGDTRGIEALKNLSPVNFLKQALKSWPEASRRLETGELGRYEGQLQGEKPGIFQRLLQYPGTMLTTGDVGAQNILQGAGFEEPVARSMTMTNEPELYMSKRLSNLGKGEPSVKADLGKAALEMMFPFKRTPLNVGEQALFNMPVLGQYFQTWRANPDPKALQYAGQAINSGVGGLAYYAGLHMDPNDPNTRTMRRFITNSAGAHGGMAAAAFAIGQAHRSNTPATVKGITAGIRQGLPLPTAEPLEDWAKFIGSGFDLKDLPHGALPSKMHDAIVPKTMSQHPLGQNPLGGRIRYIR